MHAATCAGPWPRCPNPPAGMNSPGWEQDSPPLSQRPSRLWGTEQSPGPEEAMPEEAAGQGIQESGTPSRQGPHSCAHPLKGCH